MFGFKPSNLNPKFKSTVLNESAPLGVELLDATGWTLGNGWSGDFASGFIHASGGGTATLTRAITGTGEKYYRISFTLSGEVAPNELFVTIGNSAPFDLYGQGANIIIGIKSVSDGDLVFTPITGFNKTITNISIKEINAISSPVMKITDSAGNDALEIRSTIASLFNVFIGTDAGNRNVSGHSNLGFGNGVLTENMSGFWNVGVGKDALHFNTAGSRNVAIGYAALIRNTVGQRNQAIGSFAMQNNTTGNKNIAIGSDALDHNTTGSENVAIGFSSLYNNTSGRGNIAIYGSNSITTGTYNTSIGSGALYGITDSSYNIGIGYSAYGTALSLAGGIAIGYKAARFTTGDGNTVVGFQALLGTATGNTSEKNCIFGWKAGDSITTGSRNIVIGYDVDLAAPTDSDQLNIGNLIKGNMAAGSLNVELMGGLKLAAIPTVDPHVVGQVWSNSNVLTVSVGQEDLWNLY